MQYKVFVVEDDGVASVVTALVADDEIGLIAQQMDDLTFTLISPLNSHND